jgi:hypothetical protein
MNKLSPLYAPLPSKRTAVRFGHDHPQPNKEGYVYLHQYVEPKTDWGKKHDFGIHNAMMAIESKLDFAILILGLVSLAIPPLLWVSVPLNAIRFIYRYIQGIRMPVNKINEYWERIRKGETLNLHQFCNEALKRS